MNLNVEEQWTLVEKILPVSSRILLYGPSGTGKTWASVRKGLELAEEAISKVEENIEKVTGDKKKKKKTVFIITVTEDMSMAEIRGHYVPKGNKFMWHDGVAIKAWKEGARLVINEIDKASGDVSIFLHAVLDDPHWASLTLPTGDTVKPAKGFQCIATMNGVPDDLEEALLDRFPVRMEILMPNPEAIEALPADLREVAKNTINEDGDRKISIRAWTEYAYLRGVLTEEEALISVFRERADDIGDALKLRDTRSEGGD
jgi:MoxR-like ATPase